MFGTSRLKRNVIGVLVSLVVVSTCGTMLYRALGQVPTFYRVVDGLSAEECTTEARQFLRQSTAILNQIENESVWSGVFRSRQVNAWLAWDFARKHAEILPEGISDPRVSFDEGRITLGFQMANGPVTTIVSARGRVWLPEPNYVAIELDSARAGALPIPAQVVVRTVTSAAHSAGLDIEWRQLDGKPVALIRLSRAGKPAAVRVDRIALRDGMLYLAGRSGGTSPRTAKLSPVASGESAQNSSHHPAASRLR
jgi:hypothetical protein